MAITIKQFKKRLKAKFDLGKIVRGILQKLADVAYGAAVNLINAALAPLNAIIAQARTLVTGIFDAIANAKAKLMGIEKTVIDTYEAAASKIENYREEGKKALETVEAMIEASPEIVAEVAAAAVDVVVAKAEISAIPGYGTDPLAGPTPNKGGIELAQLAPPGNWVSGTTLEETYPGEIAFKIAQQKGLKAMGEALTTIDKQMNGLGLPEQRSLRRFYSNRHPMLDENLKSLTHFKPISDQIGSSVLAYTPDQASCQFHNWFYQPMCIRKNIAYKMTDRFYSDTEAFYRKANTDMLKSISNEFKAESDKILGVYLPLGFHIIPDFLFGPDHAMKFGVAPTLKTPLGTPPSPAITTTQTIVMSMMGDEAYYLIPYLNPLKQDIILQKQSFIVAQEGITLYIDSKGNRINVKQDEPNNAVITDVDVS